MTLRKITVDNSVRYIPVSDQSKEKDIKANKIKNNSTPRKQNKNIPQNSRKFIKNVAASGFAVLK